MKCGLVQMTSTNNLAENLANITASISELARQNVSLIVLPENFAAFGLESYQELAVQEDSWGKGLVLKSLIEIARSQGVWILAGTLPLLPVFDGSTKTKHLSQKPNATSLLINDQGDIVARYDKIHLFDALVTDNQQQYRESDSYQPGRTLSIVDSPFGRIGIAVCYDLRFPEMFQAFRRRGVDIVLIPSAFTHVTGKAHWEVILRSRAIENGMYILAANQGGTHFNQRSTWGHSMIVSPTGDIQAQLAFKPGVISADIDLKLASVARAAIPTHWHRYLRSCRNDQW